MHARGSTLAIALLCACNITLPPENAFRARTTPREVAITGGLAGGTHVRFGDVDLEVIDAAGSRTDTELVSASVRDAIDDVALAAASVSALAKAASAESTDESTSEAADKTASIADRAAQALALASLLGSLAAAGDETTEAKLRAVVGGRSYRATCTSTDQRATLDVYARPSLSCAIVLAAPDAKRHWALAVRTTTGGIQVPKHEGWVEARTAKGRDDSVPILRIYTADSYGTRVGADGKDETVKHFNASFEIVTPQTRVASIMTRAYGAKPEVWLDASGLADAEARDAAAVSAAILQLYRWPELEK